MVIAGPNGAGKSTFSDRLSHPDAIIFDPDKEKKIIERAYPDISDEALENAVTQRYQNEEFRALSAQKNLTVETNLRNEYLAERAEYFKTKGYRTKMIFMLLPTLGASMDRVNQRVSLKGHFVDQESIRYNFEKSKENLLKVAKRFDEVMLTCAAFDYGIKSIPEPLLLISEGKVEIQSPHIPNWASPIVNDTIKLFDGPQQDNTLRRTR